MLNLILKFKHKQFSGLVIATGIVGFFLCASLYALTRPCVLSRCQIITQAEDLAQSMPSLDFPNTSNSKILTTKQKLVQSVNLLESIPWWSRYYAEALILKKKYQEKINNLELIIQINKTEEKALSLSKAAPFSSSKLQESKKLWKEIIENLEIIELDHDFRDFANAKEKKIQKNIEDIQQKISLEKKAAIKLEEAKRLAKLASDRNNNAKNLSDLQLVYNTWQIAIKNLQEISPKTSFHGSSRPLLETYLAQIIKARKRQYQEELALKYYNQAAEQARLAKSHEARNQWLQAISYWNYAIKSLEKAPKNTFKVYQFQVLVSNYHLNLNHSTKQFHIVLETNEIQKKINSICQEKSQICKYKLTENTIVINLNSVYVEQIWNTALQAKVQGDRQMEAELLNHLSNLEYQLQKISNETGKSIKVYNTEGNLITTYQAGG